jgi:hypothetical protein
MILRGGFNMKLFKWLRRLFWWWCGEFVQVRAFIEGMYGYKVDWDYQYKQILVNGKCISKYRFTLFPSGRYYALPRDIMRAVKDAGLPW